MNNYFDDLLPGSVTHVTPQKPERVTPKTNIKTRNNNNLKEVSRMARVSRTNTVNTDNKLTASNEIAIRGWLSFIEETDTEMIDAVLDQCRNDPDARKYFLWRAKEMSHQQ